MEARECLRAGLYGQETIPSFLSSFNSAIALETAGIAQESGAFNAFASPAKN